MPDFGEIYAEYFSDVYKYALTLCRNEAVAEEITQETFFKAMKQINQFNGSCKLYVWLCQIAKNTYFSLADKQSRLAPALDPEFPDRNSDPVRDFSNQDIARQLHQQLHHLKEPYKEIFTLRVFGELPFLQIGELFGKSDNWARLIFYRAKKQLQEAMK